MEEISSLEKEEDLGSLHFKEVSLVILMHAHIWE